jgi:hypothetical protein
LTLCWLLTCSTWYLKNPLNMNWNEPCLFYCHLLTCNTERQTFAGTKSLMAHGLISKWLMVFHKVTHSVPSSLASHCMLCFPNSTKT